MGHDFTYTRINTMNTATGSKASVKRKDQNETTIKFILRSVRATPEALQAFNEAQGKQKRTHHKNHPERSGNNQSHGRKP